MRVIEEVVKIKGEDITLTNQRAIYWKREKVLILSDLHIGKTAHFRKHGIPISDEILQHDLERLKVLIVHFKAKKLLVVGDLFHAEVNIDMKTFKLWLDTFTDLAIILIKGNHDRLSKQMMLDFNIQVESELLLTPFTFVHEHSTIYNEDFTISGHTHPGVMLKGKGRQRLKLPCYQVSERQIILPAFSLFTGLNTRAKPKGAVCYAFTETSIFKF